VRKTLALGRELSKEPKEALIAPECEKRWRGPNAGAGKGARLGPLTLACPLRWRAKDAGVWRTLVLGREPDWVP